MTYIKVTWHHSFPDEPVWIYSELDDERLEVRTVEVFRDGRYCYASTTEYAGSTKLSEEPMPPLREIAADSQFEPIEITKDEFEKVWQMRNAE